MDVSGAMQGAWGGGAAGALLPCQRLERSRCGRMECRYSGVRYGRSGTLEHDRCGVRKAHFESVSVLNGIEESFDHAVVLRVSCLNRI